VSRSPKYFLHPHSAGSASPGTGRPVRQYRLRLGVSPQTLQTHLTVSALSCTNRRQNATTTGHRAPPPISAQRGITPAFGYGPRLGPVRLDFHQLVLCAARRTLRAGPPADAATVLNASRFQPLGALPLTHPPHKAGTQCRHPPSHVPRASRRPGSRRLHAGHHLASTRAPAKLILKQPQAPQFRCRLIWFRHFNSGSLSLAFLVPT